MKVNWENYWFFDTGIERQALGWETPAADTFAGLSVFQMH